MARGKGSKTDDDSFKSLLARLDDNSGERQRAAPPAGAQHPAPARQEAPAPPLMAASPPFAPSPPFQGLASAPALQPYAPVRQPPPDPRGSPAIVWASIGVAMTSLAALGILGWMWLSHQQSSARTVENSIVARSTDTAAPARVDADPARLEPPDTRGRLQTSRPARIETALADSSTAPVPAKPPHPPSPAPSVAESVVRNFAQAPADEPPVRLVPHDTRNTPRISEGEVESTAPAQLPQRRPLETAPAQPATSSPEPTVAEPKLLVAPTLRARAGDATPYAAKIDGAGRSADVLRVVVAGLPDGAALSVGTAAGPGIWHVPADAIERLQLRLPTQTGDNFPLTLELQDSVGKIQARATTLVIVSPAPAAAPASPPIAVVPPTVSAPAASVPPASNSPPVIAPTVAAPPTASLPTAPRLSMDDESALVERGRLLARNGDIAGARLLFERAAEAGSGRAALLLGETYDPDVLAGMGVMGARGDLAKARRWYARAQELGLPQAGERLKALAGR